jgi:general L-amino acid transport system permease protein
MQEPTNIASGANPPFWRDERVLNVISQIVVVALVVALLAFLYRNMIDSLAQLGLLPSLDFLRLTSGFDIGESLISYSRNDTYGRAFVVGLLNTMLVAGLGVVFTTILGVIVGVARLSRNYLVNKLASVYIEILRNVPLLVLLIFWWQGVFLKLPRVKDAIILPGPIFLSNRGVAIPWGIPTESWPAYLVALGVGLLLGIGVGVALYIQGKRTGRMPLTGFWGFLTFLAVAIIAWIVLPQPLTFDRPTLTGLNTTGGKGLTPEFMALLSGLIIYTSAFVAEIVRAGIQSVSKGQTEAATALGLSRFQTLRMVVFPQALRVIVPPLTSQYLNLTKNSSLAVAIGYPDLFSVAGNTIQNQTGRAVEVFGMIMAVYLTFSLLTSFFMNWYNRRIRLIER